MLGVFGGAFDPPHLGHAMVPTYLRLRGLADHVWVVPCANHPLGKDLSPFDRRMALTRAAMAGHGDAVEVSDIEARLQAEHGGPSYTLRMLEAVAKERPTHAVRLVVGSDITGEVQRWHRWEEIERRFSPIVVPRTGHAPPGSCALPAVSSTQVRAWLRALHEGRTEAEAEAGLAAALPAAVLRLLRADEGGAGPVWLVGHGNVAAHAGPWLQGQGRTVVQLGARALIEGREPAQAEVPAGVWVLARDPALPDVARALADRGLPVSVPVLHGAGAQPAAEVLRALAERGHPVGTLHPICSLRAERPWPSPLPRAAFGVEGDAGARALALAWIGAQPWVDLQGLGARSRRAYHAACSLAANHLAVPYAAACEVLVGQGHAEPTVHLALAGLMRSALENLVGLGVPAGITGPAARGDDAAIIAHIEALEGPVASLYETLSHRLRAIVQNAAPSA